MGNIGTLALGALLIIGVLFIGYKMDTASAKAPTKKAAKAKKAPKEPKKTKVKEEYIEESISDIEEDEKIDEDMPYEDESEFFASDLTEEEEDISLFGATEEVESTFNNDIDDSILFNTEPKEELNKDNIIIPDPVVLPEDDNKEEFSSTMVFDTEKLNNELDEIDKMDHVDEMVAILGEFGKADSLPDEEPDDYSAPVYGIDEKLKELDDEDALKPLIDGPIKPSADDAESFMNELKKMKETAEAEDFVGFEVDNKDKELKDTQKRYTKRKSEEELPDIEIPKIPFTAEEYEQENMESSAIDINFLVQMEKNLKQTQKERLSQKKTTTKKSTKKKDE